MGVASQLVDAPELAAAVAVPFTGTVGFCRTACAVAATPRSRGPVAAQDAMTRLIDIRHTICW